VAASSACLASTNCAGVGSVTSEPAGDVSDLGNRVQILTMIMSSIMILFRLRYSKNI
jgi:hypothetical protein